MNAEIYGQVTRIMDTWMAATAVAYDLPVYAQDADFGAIPKAHVRRV